MEYRWAYMPTYNVIRFMILGAPSQATHWQLELLSGSLLINKTSGVLPTAAVGETWQISTLPAGVHTLRSLVGDLAVSAERPKVVRRRGAGPCC